MSDVSHGPGWWEATDGKWYPPEMHPNYVAPVAPTPTPATPTPSIPVAPTPTPTTPTPSIPVAPTPTAATPTPSVPIPVAANPEPAEPAMGATVSDVSQGPGWWEATDGKWYSPEMHPNYVKPVAPTPTPATPTPSMWTPVPSGAPTSATATMGVSEPWWSKPKIVAPIGAAIVAVVAVVVVITTSGHSTYPAAIQAGFLKGCESGNGSTQFCGCGLSWLEAHVSVAQIAAAANNSSAADGYGLQIASACPGAPTNFGSTGNTGSGGSNNSNNSNNTGNTGSGNSDNTGNTGNAGNTGSGNTGNTGNTGSGNTGNTGSVTPTTTPSGNTGDTGNT